MAYSDSYQRLRGELISHWQPFLTGRFGGTVTVHGAHTAVGGTTGEAASKVKNERQR